MTNPSSRRFRCGLAPASDPTQAMSLPTKSMLAALALLLIAGCGSAGTATQATEATGVFATEHEAAAVGSMNRHAPRPIAQLAVGESVTVLSDTYGKDYWACNVRTRDLDDGWVLCASLNYRRDRGT